MSTDLEKLPTYRQMTLSPLLERWIASVKGLPTVKAAPVLALSHLSVCRYVLRGRHGEVDEHGENRTGGRDTD